MHIALVHRDLHQRTRGGICTLYRNLAQRLAARGTQVTLITQSTPHPVHLDGVTVETLSRTDDLPAHRRAVTDVLNRVAPDIVECSTWEAEALDYLHQDAAWRAPVLVRGEFSAATLGAADLARDERELVQRAERVIAVSAFAARDLAGAYRIPSPQVVPNGIDRSRFHPATVRPPASGFRITLDSSGQPVTPTPLSELMAAGTSIPPWAPDPQGRVRLVWVGKITPMKGWDLLEDIIRKLCDEASVTVLLGHSRAYSAVTLDSTRDATILHDLDDADLPSFYRAADWLLSTSRWEGFGLAIAEALACGTPVLLPDALGTASELLAAGGGLTYQNPRHLAAILRSVPRPAARLPEHFDWDVNTDTTLALYRDLTGARQPCASS